MRPFDPSTPIARRIALLADSQHGPFGRDQLVDLGLSEDQIEYRIDHGNFFVLFPGVYAFSKGSLSELGRIMAGVLACGEGALASHCSAGLVRGVITAYDGFPQISVPRDNAPELPGLWTRKTTFHRFEATTSQNIPVTSLARTLLDLANVLTETQLTRAFQRARRQGLTIKQLDRLLEAHRGERGTGVLRALVDLHREDKGASKGGFEDAFYAWLLTILPKGFPRPERNKLVKLSDGSFIEADLLWPHLRMIFELDFFDHHGGDRVQTTLDRQRDRDVRLDEWGLERFTSDEFTINRARVERDVRRLLAI